MGTETTLGFSCGDASLSIDSIVSGIGSVRTFRFTPKTVGDRDLNVLLTPLPREKRAKLAGRSAPESNGRRITAPLDARINPTTIA
jgi:hypothetical protein